MMNLNINERCSVVLTAFGAEVYNESMSALPSTIRPDQKKEGDKLDTQLWCLFQTFGPHIHLGMSAAPFDKMNIELPEKFEQLK